MRRYLIKSALAALLCGAPPAWTCQTPVYEWARLNWRADDYTLTIHHDAPLSPTQQAWIAPGPEQVNLVVGTAQAGEAYPELPWAVLRYPFAPPNRAPAWAGPFAAETLSRVADSPKRREVVSQLNSGAVAVWILLESGHAEDDSRAWQTLAAGLEGAEQALLDAATNVPEGQTAPVLPEQIRWHTIRLARDDTAEAILTALLLGSEADLRHYEEPMAFPVFGRGRALYALVGAGITADLIREACVYLTTACTCTVKDDNPGTDLLLAADWKTMTAGAPSRTPVAAAPVLEAAAKSFWLPVIAALATALTIMALATIMMVKRN